MKINNLGLSLVGVMVAAGIMGVVALGVAQLAQNMGKIKQDTYAVMDEMNLEQTVRSRFFNKLDDGNPATPDNGCTATFNQAYSRLANDDENLADVFNPIEGVQSELFLLNAAGNGRGDRLLSYQAGSNKFGIITIEDIRLFFPQPDSGNPQEFTEGQHSAQINVYVTKKYGQQANGTPFIKRKIVRFPMLVDIAFNGGWRIVDCNPAGTVDIDTSSDDPDAPVSNERACNMAGKYYDENANPPCKMSRGAPNMLPEQGGYGGAPSMLRCPQHMAVTGIWGTAGSLLDSIGLICKEINYQSLSPMPGEYYTSRAGGNGGNSFTDRCPSGSFAIGIRGNQGSKVDRISLVCGNFNNNNSLTGSTPFRGGSGGTAFTDYCASKTILREVLVRSGSLIDLIRGACW